MAGQCGSDRLTVRELRGRERLEVAETGEPEVIRYRNRYGGAPNAICYAAGWRWPRTR